MGEQNDIQKVVQQGDKKITYNIGIIRSRLSSTAGRTLNDLGEAEGSYEVATRSVT